MQLKNYLVSNYSFIVALCASFLFASCGSYQYVGYDDDGIYETKRVVYQETPNDVSTDANSSSYYKNYFAEKAQQYEDATNQEDVIFTDVDSYESNYTQELDTLQTLEYRNDAYAGWGQNSTEIVVVDRTIFRPWFGYGYYGFANPWGGFGPFYGDPFFYGAGFNYGFGFNNWGFNRWGFNRWGGLGYNPWYCPPFYNYGYGGRYGNVYGNRYYGNRYGSRIAYNTGRRSYSSESGRYSTTRRSDAVTRNNRTTRDSRFIRNRSIRSQDGTNRTLRRPVNSANRQNSVNRPTRSTNRAVSPNNRNTRPRVNSTPRRSNNTIRRSSPQRSNNIRRSAPVRSRSSSMSRGSTRSSSSMSRGSRSSGRSSGSIRRNN